MAEVCIDLTEPDPDLRPGDRIVKVATRNGIVEELHVDRPTAGPRTPSCGLDRDRARTVLAEMIWPGQWPQLLDRLAECIVSGTGTGS